MLSESLLAASHFATAFKSSLSFLSDRSIATKVVSLANKYTSELLTTFGRSLTYKRKRSGPKMDPCEKPLFIVQKFDCTPDISTHCLRFDK